MNHDLFLSGLSSNLSHVSIMGTTFTLISLAEMGDKSQLVCMTLAARHRGLPVFMGGALAFIVLNLLAVVFGASVAVWIPEWGMALGVGLLFGLFGVQMLKGRGAEEEESDQVDEPSGHSILITSFLLIFMAEFGDKTQIAVAALAGRYDPLSVWVGGTVALIFISALGMMAGKKLQEKMQEETLHKASGLFFLILAVLSFWKAASFFLEIA